MMYIKIGDIILNRDAIAHIELNAKSALYRGGFKNGVRITMKSLCYDSETGASVSETFFFEDEEAEAIQWYFSREGNETFADIKQLFEAELRSKEESE